MSEVLRYGQDKDDLIAVNDEGDVVPVDDLDRAHEHDLYSSGWDELIDEEGASRVDRIKEQNNQSSAVSTIDELIEKICEHSNKMGGSLDDSARAFGYTIEQLREMANHESQGPSSDAVGNKADAAVGHRVRQKSAYRGGGRGRIQSSDRDLDPGLSGSIIGMSPEELMQHRRQSDEIVDQQYYLALERAKTPSDMIIERAKLRASRDRRQKLRDERDRRNGIQ